MFLLSNVNQIGLFIITVYCICNSDSGSLNGQGPILGKTQDDASENVFTIMFEKSKFLQERKNNNYNTEKPTLTLEYKSKCNVKNFENQWERRFQQ